MTANTKKTALERNIESQKRKRQNGMVVKNVWLPKETAEEMRAIQKEKRLSALGKVIEMQHEFYLKNQ